MEFDWIPRWWGVITTAAAMVATIAMLWLSKTFSRREDLNRVEQAVANINGRVSNLEAMIESMPTQEGINALHLEISDMRGDIKALREALKPVNHMAQLLLEQRLSEK